MRTRTKRWLAIVVAAALPAATLVALFDQLGEQPARPPGTVDRTECRDLWALRRLDEGEALDRARQAADDTKASADRRHCATELVLLLDRSERTLANAVTDAADEALATALGWLGRDDEVGFTDDGGDGRTAAVVVGIDLALLAVAVRQLMLWRAERRAGPVLINDITPPKDEESSVQLAHVLRTTLSKVGIPTTSAAPGDLTAVVIDPATDLAPATPATLVARALAALPRALAPPSGFTVTAQAHPRVTGGPRGISLEVKVTRTGATFANISGEGPTYVAATEDAARALYCKLVSRKAVRSRTPLWLAWSSKDTLERFNRAKDLKDRRSAAEDLTALCADEPANVLVALAASSRWWDAGWGTAETRVLAPATGVDIVAVEGAIRASARALHVVPRHDDTLFQLAIHLGYAEMWQASWGQLSPASQARLVADLEQAVRGMSWRRRTWRITAHATPADIGSASRTAAAIALRTLVANQRYPRILRKMWPLAARRDHTARGWPWSRQRFLYRHVALALLDATDWDRHRLDGSPGVGTNRLGSAIRRARILGGRRLALDHSRIAEWDLALAYAAEAQAQAQHSQPYGQSPIPALERRAGRTLRRAMLSREGRIKGTDLDDLVVTPEVADPQLEIRPPFASVVSPLLRETAAERSARVWDEQVEEIDTTIGHAQAAWHRHRRQLDGGVASWPGLVPGSPSIDGVVEWFRADAALWKALADWAAAPARSSARAALGEAREKVGPDAEVPGRPRRSPLGGGQAKVASVATASVQAAVDAQTSAVAVELAADGPQRWTVARAEAAAAATRWAALG